ncbi:hypothetical protein GCM10011309_06530 [Litorimonas cladophorae]|uniref:ETC complex I subunit n=1 Tax=Litorimonas cladophorae TaxID=1220491 RepID=A0A918KF77_9PROT|nr:NADH dehydrogenase ubiquinone Fe-S protein 4 [Litorimonas cladophorae]GGX59477.1 hypothetical protein GCM10011309_06530 [Litorimonas cladophorae]
MFAKIYKPEASAMTSGRANLDMWCLEYQSAQPSIIDPLTGNARNVDTREQLELRFDSLEDAVAYAKANGIPHRIVDRPKSKRIPRSYSENFDYDRKLPWTH